MSLKKRRLEERGVAGNLMEVKLAANVALQVDLKVIKGGLEPTTAADMVKFFSIQRHTSLASLSLRDNREDVSYENQHRTFMRCPDVVVTLMDPTSFYLLAEYLNATMGFPIFNMHLRPKPNFKPGLINSPTLQTPEPS